MVAVITRPTRPVVPEARVRTSRAVSAIEWGGAAELGNWIQSRGGCPIPAAHVGLEVSTSAGSPTTLLETSLSSESSGWWRESAVACVVFVGATRAAGRGRVDVTVGDGTTTYGTFEVWAHPAGRGGRSPDYYETIYLPARGGELDLVVEAVANVSGVVVDVVQVMEVPRSRLELDKYDYGVLPASVEANASIQDTEHLSARGAVDAYLYADARRQGYFHALSRSNPVVISIDTGGAVEVIPFGIPLQAPILAPGDTTRDDIIVAVDMRWDDDGDPTNSGSVTVATDEGGSSLVQSSIASTWTTYLFRPDVACEDLDSVDGRRSSAWEMLRISADVGVKSGAPQLDIGTISVFSSNAQGESGWSGSDYYSMASDDLSGSDTMTVSILFRYDSGSDEVLLEHQDGAQGWSLYVASTGGLRFKVNDGTTDHYITSAALVPGTTYVGTGSFDGSHLRLVLGQVASTPVAVAGSFSAASTTAAMGAFAGGALPASGSDIIGAAFSAAVALSDAQMLAHNALCAAVGDIRPFGGAEHLWSARFGLHTDLIGDAHWTINGATTLERFAPRMG